MAETEKTTLSCNTINQKTKKLVLRKLPLHSLGGLGFIGECNFRSSSVSCQTSRSPKKHKKKKTTTNEPHSNHRSTGCLVGKIFTYLAGLYLSLENSIKASSKVQCYPRWCHSKHPLLIFGKFPQEGTKN